MSIYFDDYIKQLVVYYDPECDQNDILYKLYNNEWDIIAVRDSMIIEGNKNISLLHRDIITNIKSDDALLFYIIDGIKYSIRDDTRFITALTPFKPITINAKSTYSKVHITFTRLMLKNKLINELRKNAVYDDNFTYLLGEIYVF